MSSIKPYTPDPTSMIFPGAVVMGDVTMGKRCSVWYNAVIRAEDQPVIMGDDSNIQDCSVVHVGKDFPVRIGKGVTVGHGVILHGCTIGDNTLIGMGATLLNGCVIGRDCIVAAGALVTEGMVVPDGSMVMGFPAKVKRPLTPEEIEKNRWNSDHYIKEMEKYR